MSNRRACCGRTGLAVEGLPQAIEPGRGDWVIRRVRKRLAHALPSNSPAGMRYVVVARLVSIVPALDGSSHHPKGVCRDVCIGIVGEEQYT